MSVSDYLVLALPLIWQFPCCSRGTAKSMSPQGEHRTANWLHRSAPPGSAARKRSLLSSWTGQLRSLRAGMS